MPRFTSYLAKLDLEKTIQHATIHLHYIILYICRRARRKSKKFCAFIDFVKAFDSVWRIGLWNKLIKSKKSEIFNICTRVINHVCFINAIQQNISTV